MIKKISSVILAVALLVTCMTPIMVSADNEIIKYIHVPADIEFRPAGGTYTDGPVTHTYSSVGAIPKYDFKATLTMDDVKTEFKRLFVEGRLNDEDNWNLVPEFVNNQTFQTLKSDLYLAGDMTIEIVLPASANFEVNAEFLGQKQMDGFAGSTAIHKETTTERVVDGEKTITINTKVVSPLDPNVEYLAATVISEHIDDYLGDISLECTGNTIKDFETYTIKGSVEGTTTIYLDRIDSELNGNEIHNDNIVGTIKYYTDLVSETLKIQQSSPSYGGGGGTVPKPSVTVDFSVHGDKTVIEPVTGKNGKVTVDLDKVTPPEIEGYISDGKWYEDPAHTKEVSGQYTVTENTTLYTTYINMTVPSALIEDHHGYIQGYPDGNVKPDKNVSREEVAALLYRLLKEDVRESLRNNESHFEDVDEDRWSHSEIATMVKGGYIKGYDDGTFRPGKPITRAEFATLITRFIDEDSKPAVDTTFDDIENHWAKEYIEKAASHMLISGYVNGSFKPDKYITRAEAVTILNNILVRHVDEDGLHENAKHWPDNNETDWYYYQVLEATNSHDHDRRDNSHLEDWTAHNDSTDWTQH